MPASDFQISTRYPMDKVVFLREFTLTLDNFGMANTKIAHGLPDTPFCNAVLSLDNWQTTYQAGTNRIARQSYSDQFDVASDATNISFSAYFDGEANKTAKIRVWGFYNSTSNAMAPATRQLSANQFVLNSKYNYLKLLKDGVANVTNSNVTVAHNLGYVPIVQLWAELAYGDGGWTYYNRPDSLDASSPSGQACAVSTTGVTFRSTTLYKINRFYYRIYADAA